MISDLLFKRIEINKRAAERNAVVDGNRSFTYGKLCKLIDSFGSVIRQQGIQKGETVAIYLPNSVEFIISFFALSRLGVISLPLNVTNRETELEYYLSTTGSRYVITEGEYLSEIEGLKSSCDLKLILVKGESNCWSVEKMDEISTSGTAIDEDDKVLYLFSTGSTGKPKCISRTHANLRALAENHTSTAGWNEDDGILMAVPMSHTYGFGNFVSAIQAGATIYTIADFNRKEVTDILSSGRITTFPAVPFMLDMLSRSRNLSGKDFSSLKLVFSAGAPLATRIFQDFKRNYGIYPRQLYGSSETGVISINMSRDIEKKNRSVGRPVKNVEVKIVDNDGKELTFGEEGEIIVKSPSMTSCYENSDQESEKSFRNGFYYTGDTGFIDDKGYIFITGRKKLFINISGYKVDPVELEQLLLENKNIREVAVKGELNASGQEIIKAFIVPEKTMKYSEIVDFCRSRISEYKIPRIVEFRESLPKSPTGKILKAKL